MHIRIYPLNADGTPTGGAPVLITGTAPEEGPMDGRIVPSQQTRIVPLFRAAAQLPKFDGNRARRVEFALQKTHASAGAANEYLLDHPEAVPPYGRVELQIYESNGSFRSSRNFARATISISEGSFKGKSTTFRYVIEGGQITI